MAWTQEDSDALQLFKHNVDCDDVRFKQVIKEHLLDNRYLIHLLNNDELDEDEPDSYFNVSILPYFVLEETITDVKNRLCYEISFEKNRYDKKKLLKNCQIVFNIVCDLSDIIEQETNAARHDLIAAVIYHQFDWTNIFGMQIHCVSDKPSMLGANLACRTLIFQGEVLNGIAKTVDGETRVVNSDVVR